MKYIPLSGEVGAGKFIIVDDQDYDYLSQQKWHWSHGYAIQNIYIPGGNRARKKLYIHHLILVTNGMIDHINGDKLDNRRSNLRECTFSQNVGNTGLRKNNKSGFKGVHWSKKDKKWRAVFRRDGLGLFDDLNEAATAYQQAHHKFYGEFSRIK